MTCLYLRAHKTRSPAEAAGENQFDLTHCDISFIIIHIIYKYTVSILTLHI